MKRLLALFLCLCLLAVLPGCGGEDAYVPTGDGLTWDEDYTGPVNTVPADESQEVTLIHYPDRSLNPYTCTDHTNQALFSLLYQGLFSVSREYVVEPVLCKQYRISADMRTYTFYPEAATFSNGKTLSARDVEQSLLAAKESPVYGGRFSHVQSITQSPDGGVVVTLDTAYENLPMLLDVPIFPADQVAANCPAGTGPYAMEGSGAAALLRRRTDWWCKAKMAVTAPVIRLLVAQSNTQIRDTFEFESLSLVYTDPGSDRYADYRCDYELWDCENGIFVYLACNMNSEIFSKPELRAALSGVVDRDTIAATHYRGFARGASLPASPQSPYYNSTLAARYAYDGGEAMKAAVSSAGLPGDAVVKFLVNSDDTLRLRVARQIAEALRSCGLQVEMVEQSSSQFRYYLEMGWYDLYLGQTKLSANMDLTAFFSRSGALRYGSLDSVNFYTLCMEALANHGNLYTLHQNVMEDGRLCPVVFRSYAVYATRGLLTELTPARDSVFYYSLEKSMDKALIRES